MIMYRFKIGLCILKILFFFIFFILLLRMISVDTRELQPSSHECNGNGDKEVLGLATVKSEPGSTTGPARLLHDILSQHPQQHGLTNLQNGYSRHLGSVHQQLVQQPYTTVSLATTNTTG